MASSRLFFALMRSFLLLWAVCTTCISWFSSAVVVALFVYIFNRYRVKPIVRSSLRRLGIFDGDFSSGPTRSEQSILLYKTGGGSSTEMSMEPVTAARSAGAQGVVLDLSLSLNETIVLANNKTLRQIAECSGLTTDFISVPSHSLSGAPRVDSSHMGPRASVPFPDAGWLTNGSRRSLDFSAGSEVGGCSLDQVLQECLATNLFIVLHCREIVRAHRVAQLLDRAFRSNPALYNTCVVTSPYPSLLFELGVLNKEVVTGLVLGPGLTEQYLALLPRVCTLTESPLVLLALGVLVDPLLEWAHATLLPLFCGAAFLAVHKDFACRSTVDYWRGLGLEVMVTMPHVKADVFYFQHSLHVPVIGEATAKERADSRQASAGMRLRASDSSPPPCTSVALATGATPPGR